MVLEALIARESAVRLARLGDTRRTSKTFPGDGAEEPNDAGSHLCGE